MLVAPKTLGWQNQCLDPPMFEPPENPRVFGLPPGVDFPKLVVDGLVQRLEGQSPEALARVEVFVNTRRMQRRIKALFDNGPARLLPRIRLVTDLATDALISDLPPAASPLRRRLELTQLIAKLLDQQPDLAPRAALFDLADSLAALMDEMRGEGVLPETIRTLDVSDVSGHWQRSLKFIALVESFYGPAGDNNPDVEARQRLVIENLCAKWQESPPAHPVVVAGSTGSRGATALFMQAVARLPQGAVILPGVDFDMPRPIWDRLDTAAAYEDHPQFRFARLMGELNGHPKDIRRWQTIEPPCPARNRLVSLALRPAPVTDQWLTEGQRLDDIAEAADGVTLIEAPSVRAEATSIALALRQAVEDGQNAALITPDRTLTRQVTAALDRWGVVPDDSAGRPLPLSAPGRLLRHVADLFGQVLSIEALLTILKHPLTSSGADRGPHLLHTRELELHIRRNGPPFPGKSDLLDWGTKGDAGRLAWAIWLSELASGLDQIGPRSLTDHLTHHISLTEALAAGPGQSGSGALWAEAAGREALRWVAELRRESSYGGVLSPFDYSALFHSVLQRGEVREATLAHPGVMIWGTLEARVQGADLVILGGLNEGIWPEAPTPDPWLNRALRDKAGLLLPERRIGLAAHDFQQAIAARRVILTRAVRDAEAQTVPSRWVNRICNLLGGLPGEGETALSGMRARGQAWLGMAELLDAPRHITDPAPRPSPQPPVKMRPREISITEVQTLIRDPYAVYARRILGLRALDPLRPLPEAPLRGTLIHRILERFIREAPVTDFVTDKARLITIADEVFQTDAPWPAAQRLWRARLMRVVDWFVQSEIARQVSAHPEALECKARWILPDLDMVLYGTVDRVDRADDGRLVIYDYKSGNPPSAPVQEHFDKQLMLSALLAENGGLTGIDASKVAAAGYIGFGSSGSIDTIALEPGMIAEVLADLTKLFASYHDRARGYTSRRAIDSSAFAGVYDHLARLGEWDESFVPVGIPVG